MSPTVVAIDGPAGSGKSSVAKGAARRLGFGYLDTGAAYRALAWHCLETGVDLRGSGDDAADSLIRFELAIGTDPDRYFVSVGSDDVTDAIREPRVSEAVSAVARVPQVREDLTRRFRELIAAVQRPGIIVEGRDITTVVAPDAEVRILLTADVEVRMARRSAELTGIPERETARALTDRDAQDSRVVDFLHAAPGVTTIDSTNLDLDGTIDAVMALVEEQRA